MLLRARGTVIAACCVLLALCSTAQAQEKLIPPPYALIGFDTIVTGVTWDEAAIRKALPPGVTPAAEMTGGINIYKVADAFGPGPYTAAYFWVDLEGMNASDGTKGRWMLTGVYGPSDKAKGVFEQFLGLPIRNGTARHEAASGGAVRAIGSIGSQDLVVVEAKVDTTKCGPGGGAVNFLSDMQGTNHFITFPAAFWGEVCPAEVSSAKVVAPAGDPFAQFQPKKVNWAIRFRGSVAVAPPNLRP